MLDRIKVGVIGTGSLGKEHARIYSALAEEGLVTFSGVYDQNPEAAARVAQKHSVPVFRSIAEAGKSCQALSIVTPTVTHFEIAHSLLLSGKHLLIEKPMTVTGEEAEQLVQLAQKNHCLLQVGHVERFNPVFKYLQSVATHPQFIEAHRLSPYPARSTDIGVVLDLMIHDLDIVLAFVGSEITRVDGVGVQVLSSSEDIANARLTFANGCVANLTASRISPERLRKIRVFSGGPAPAYVSLDYRAQEGYIYRIAADAAQESSFIKKLLSAKDSAIVSEFGGKKIIREPVPITKDEPLKLELSHFVECVKARHTPLVSGESAKKALEVALEITRQIKSRAAAV
jgi:predicted dehydrogenase